MLKGFNCAQSVLLAFAKDVGLDETAAARMASGLGGGVGGLREMCGAVSATAVILGMLTGYSEPDDRGGKVALYRDVRALVGKFQEENGAIICRDLLKGEAARVDRDPYPRTPEYYVTRPCVKLVGDAAENLARYCAEHGIPLT